MGVVRRALALCAASGLAAAGCGTLADVPADSPLARMQPPARTPMAASFTPPSGKTPLPDSLPPADPTDTPLPINLATALQLAGARPLDVQIAGKQIAAAVARYDRARLLWVPNLVVGPDYFLHTGPQQAVTGEIVKQNRDSFMFGLGPNVVFAFSDAVYAPLAARQDLRARQAEQQAAINDTTLDVADAYFNVQQARGELAAALVAVKHAETLAEKTAGQVIAKGYAPAAEQNRANAELGRRKQAAAAARERWRTASAELARLLRLDPSAVVEPVEPPYLPVTVIDAAVTVDGLIPIALATRPELAGHQAVVEATLARLKQEKLRPLVPSLALRGVSTPTVGTLGYGLFGGGRDGSLKDFGGRLDIDVQLLWEFQALGFGNRTRIDERRAEYEAATLELFRTQDRIAAEVVAAFARVRAAAERVNDAEPALREAVELVNKMTEGLGQTRRIGDALVLIVRPQEATAAVQAFAQASTDFFAAVADYNRAQFQLYRALGHPAQCLAGAVAGDPASENKPAQALPPPADLSVEEPHPAVTVRPASAVTPAVDALPPPLSLRPPVVVQERER